MRAITSAMGLSLVLLLWSAALVSAADNVTEFRGADGSGQSEETGIPAKWSEEENLAWRTELPGPGGSSPIVLGERIYLTCYTGYGLQPNEGDDSDLMRHLLCLDRKSGKVLWKKEFKPELPESDYSGGNSSRHGFSTSTIATDGERLYVFFGKSGVYCLDLDGKQIWRSSVGSGKRSWGSGASPRLFKDLVLINASVESGSLIALNKKTGDEVWKTRVQGSWNTPTLVKVGDATELVMSLPQRIVGYDPNTGKELWSCDGIPDRGYTCPSPIAKDGVVYVIGGRRNTAIAVKAGGRGDVTESHVLWTAGKGSNVTSPVLHEGHLYWVHEVRGLAICLNAETGDVVYEERLQPRPGLVYASMTYVDGKIIALSQNNGAFVLAAKPEFQLLSHNTFDDNSRSNACPVVSKGKLFLRSDRFLYCVGAK